MESLCEGIFDTAGIGVATAYPTFGGNILGYITHVFGEHICDNPPTDVQGAWACGKLGICEIGSNTTDTHDAASDTGTMSGTVD